MNNLKLMLLILLVCLLSAPYGAENQKIAQTGMQFLSVVSDAKAASMAEAMTSLQLQSSALFFNPAGMAGMEKLLDVSISSNKWIADINHYTLSAAYNPVGGDYGVFGLSIQSVDYGSFIGTVRNTGTFKGYDDTRIFSLSSLAVGVGYARELTDRFSIGAQVRYVHQDLGDSKIVAETIEDSIVTRVVNNELSPFVFDFGTLYKTGLKSLVFGMSVRNFSREIKYADEGFQAPLVFNLGISMDLMDLFEEMSYEQKLIMSVDANHHQDKKEQIKVGFQYQALKIFSLRAGFLSGEDLSALSYGLGLSHLGFTFDYSYTPYDMFDNVQRITGRFSF